MMHKLGANMSKKTTPSIFLTLFGVISGLILIFGYAMSGG